MKSYPYPQKRKWASRLLFIEAGIVFIFLSVFLIQYFKMRDIDPVYANSYYPLLAEYLVGSLVISIASAALVDILENDGSKT